MKDNHTSRKPFEKGPELLYRNTLSLEIESARATKQNLPLAIAITGEQRN
jgi:hypothetical protein